MAVTAARENRVNGRVRGLGVDKSDRIVLCNGAVMRILVGSEKGAYLLDESGSCPE